MARKDALRRAEDRVCSLSIRYALSLSPDTWHSLEQAQRELRELRELQERRGGESGKPAEQ